jgi:hypothetical protein
MEEVYECHSFFIQGESFWKLSQLHDSKDFIIKTYDELFNFTKSHLILLSSSAFSHYKRNTNPFELIPPSDFLLNQVLSAFFLKVQHRLKLIHQITRFFIFWKRTW